MLLFSDWQIQVNRKILEVMFLWIEVLLQPLMIAFLYRALRASRIISAVILEESFRRPDGFDLGTFWQQWCAEFEESRPVYKVTAWISPALIPLLGSTLGIVLGNFLALSP